MPRTKVITQVTAFECPQCLNDMICTNELSKSPKGARRRRFGCTVCDHIEVIYKDGQEDGYKPYLIQIEKPINK